MSDEKNTEIIPETPLWVARLNVDGRTFRTAKEYTNYMDENRLWGKHSEHLTHEEWEAMKAKSRTETGEDLGTLKFVPGQVKKKEG
jgi:hypothetical protein